MVGRLASPPSQEIFKRFWSNFVTNDSIKVMIGDISVIAKILEWKENPSLLEVYIWHGYG